MGPFRTTARRRRKRKPARAALPAVRGALPAVRGALPAVRSARKPRGARSRLGVRRPSWKVVGLAGMAGVAATGVVVARQRRAHRELPPDELRERLHSRLADSGVGAQAEPAASAETAPAAEAEPAASTETGAGVETAPAAKADPPAPEPPS